MVMRKKGVLLLFVAALSVLWLLFLVSNYKYILISFGGQRSHKSEELQTGDEPLEVFTEIPQSASEADLSHAAFHPEVLILTPLKQAAPHLDRYFALLHSLTYPKNALSLGFLVSDSTDATYSLVRAHFLERKRLISHPDEKYRAVTLIQQSFNYSSSGGGGHHELRHQIMRRGVLARSRNYLLLSSLRPRHEWVLWIDCDVSRFPTTLVQDLLGFTSPERLVVVPNSFWRDEEEGVERPYDRNSWRETEESREFLRRTREVVVFEGYSAYSTGRISLGEMRGGQESVVKVDGVGGTVLLVRARLHREGLVFLPVPFEKAIETEALGKLALAMGYQPWGLPNYVTFH